MKNRQQNNIISFILITALFLSGLFSCPNAAYGLTKYVTTTYYRLDTGVIFLWRNSAGAWQYDREPGGSDTFSTSISIPKHAENIAAAAYDQDADYGELGYFPFKAADKIAGDSIIWNKTGIADNKDDYDYYYLNHSSCPLSVSKEYTSSTGNLKITYDATFRAYRGEDYDVKVKLMEGETGKQEIIDLLGSPSPEITEAMDLMNPESENYNSNVEGYLYFLPVVIKYDITEVIEIGDFEPELNLPKSAKQDKEYTVSDATTVDSECEIDHAVLEKRYDDGAWEEVDIWDGLGRPGINTKGNKKESCGDVCTVTYRLTVYDTNGQEKSATKTIEITDKRDISVTADLVLPAYTFEGHKTPARDQSIIEVDGVKYSAERAYAEKIARNSFKENTAYGVVSRLTSTQANVTFSKSGNYSVTLTVTPVSGSKATDTEPIEVKKTPFIVESLGGFQKQNRKQILNIAVATFPGKPITEYSITLKDKKTGGTVTLTEDNPQENNATIKTRAVSKTESDDGCFAYFTVEFLTKTPVFNPSHPNSTQDFYYEIRMKDSKGDTDTASKTFPVIPDLPPKPAISLDSSFLRNEGTNIASIKTEDATVAADGDSVERTWHYGATTTPAVYTDVSTMDGYKKLSFGTDKIVSFNKTGVGKFSTKLYVKEIWTEPTLDEYVADSDHLTGTAVAYSDVQNVAPVVSLQLLNGTEKDVLLIANNDAEYQTLFNNKTALKQALLANKIDANVVIKKLIGSTPSDVTGIQQKISYTFPTAYWNNGESDRNTMIADSEKTYFTTWTMVGNTGFSAPVTVHAYNPYSGQVWSYTSNDPVIFSFNQDDMGKYLYLVYSSHTVILDKKTGTVAGNIGMPLTGSLYVTDNLFFSLEGTTLYAIDQNSLMKTTVDTDVYAVARVGSNMQYITRTDIGVVKNTLNTTDFSTTRELLVDTNNGLGSAYDYVPECIDSSGKVVLFKYAGGGTDTFSGVRVYSPDNKLIQEIPVAITGTYGLDKVFTPLDENGECHHAVVWLEDTDPRPNAHAFIGVNLDNGSSAGYYSRTDSLNSMGFTAFESGGTTYMYGAGWYLNGGTYYWGSAFRITYNGSSIGTGTTGTGMIGTYDEAFCASDRMIASYWGDNSLIATLKFQISAFPKSLVQETKEILGKFSNKSTFVGGVSTTADQIKATIDTPKPVIKVSANNDGYLSLNNLSLIPGQKYYYEYDIKPLTNGTKDKLTGVSAATGTSSSSQSFNNDTLYVTDSYEEDFNDTSINKFFKVNSSGNFYNGKCGSYNDTGASSLSYSFTVPADKQAILSFDYDFYFKYPSWIGTNIFVDGLRMDENPDTSADDGSGYVKRTGHKIFYKVLGPGTHTIETRVSVRTEFWNWVLIDNLVVDLVSPTPIAKNPTFGISDTVEKNWYNANGTFNTVTKTLSYGAQSSYPSYGGLPGAVTAYTYYKGNNYPETIEYYQTVPAGYLQKGLIHLGSNYIYNYPRIIYTIAGVKAYTFSSDGTVDQWVYAGVKPAGTYTHTVDIKRGERYQGWIDAANVVTYPDNAITESGNMAFNSSNTEYFFPKVTSTGKTSLSIFMPKGEYLIKNLRVYYMNNGQKVYLENKTLENITQLPSWTLSSGLTASNVNDTVEKKDDDEYVKIYKKGERVLYNIFYDDYERDPSKAGYWVYQHINWPPDTLHPDVGKVLTAPIDRFYLSGKYTVTHWEADNTQRTGTVGDATPYNKESNKVDLVFYVNGDGKAPWVTYIKTNPGTVKENNAYTIAVGVDDAEKDTLRLETEVYLNGKRLFDHIRENLTADSSGSYPETLIGGLPAAKPGVYQAVCTVSDYSGTGVKSYKFTVVSDGKVTGFVSHTDQWDANRKKYNMKRFSEEVNRTLQFNDYGAMQAPRMRGTNVFWSGEKFMLRAETEGGPEHVTAEILSRDAQGGLKSTGYSAELTDTGRKNAAGAELWEGSLWNASMINKWGRKAPEELVFRFTARYPENVTKTHTVSVIMDTDRDYWQLHRLW